MRKLWTIGIFLISLIGTNIYIFHEKHQVINRFVTSLVALNSTLSVKSQGGKIYISVPLASQATIRQIIFSNIYILHYYKENNNLYLVCKPEGTYFKLINNDNSPQNTSAIKRCNYILK